MNHHFILRPLSSIIMYEVLKSIGTGIKKMTIQKKGKEAVELKYIAPKNFKYEEFENYYLSNLLKHLTASSDEGSLLDADNKNNNRFLYTGFVTGYHAMLKKENLKKSLKEELNLDGEYESSCITLQMHKSQTTPYTKGIHNITQALLKKINWNGVTNMETFIYKCYKEKGYLTIDEYNLQIKAWEGKYNPYSANRQSYWHIYAPDEHKINGKKRKGIVRVLVELTYDKRVYHWDYDIPSPKDFRANRANAKFSGCYSFGDQNNELILTLNRNGDTERARSIPLTFRFFKKDTDIFSRLYNSESNFCMVGWYSNYISEMSSERIIESAAIMVPVVIKLQPDNINIPQNLEYMRPGFWPYEEGVELKNSSSSQTIPSAIWDYFQFPENKLIERPVYRSLDEVAEDSTQRLQEYFNISQPIIGDEYYEVLVSWPIEIEGYQDGKSDKGYYDSITKEILSILENNWNIHKNKIFIKPNCHPISKSHYIFTEYIKHQWQKSKRLIFIIPSSFDYGKSDTNIYIELGAALFANKPMVIFIEGSGCIDSIKRPLPYLLHDANALNASFPRVRVYYVEKIESIPILLKKQCTKIMSI